MILSNTSYSDFVEAIRPHLPSFEPWRTIEKAIDGAILTKKQQKFFESITGRIYKSGMMRNIILICGRRSGKSTEVGYWLPYRALTFNGRLAYGETASNLVITPSYRASNLAIDYCAAILEQVEQRSGTKLIARRRRWETTASVDLINQTSIRSQAVNRLSGRSQSCWSVAIDEAAFLKPTGLFSGSNVFEAVAGSMASFGHDSRFFILSSPSGKEGLLWDLYQRFYGKDQDEVVIIQASSLQMNPTLSTEWLEEQRELFGTSWYQREIMAQFVDSVNAAFSGESIDACIVAGRVQLQPASGTQYMGFLDPSGLSPHSVDGDEFIASVGHKNAQGKIIQDAMAAWDNSVSPDDALATAIELFRRYNVRRVISDRYSGAWVQPKLQAAGFIFEFAPVNKNIAYLELAPVLNSGGLELLDDRLQTAQLRALEIKSAGNKSQVYCQRDHHDDRSDIVALLSFVLSQQPVQQPSRISDIRVGSDNRTNEMMREIFGDETPNKDWSHMS